MSNQQAVEGKESVLAFLNLLPAGIRFIYASGGFGGDHPQAVYRAPFPLFLLFLLFIRSLASALSKLQMRQCNSSPSPYLKYPE